MEMLLIPLIGTIVIELGVLLMMGERRRKVLYGSVVINVLTNVPLNLYALYEDKWLLTVVAGETTVVVVEALWYGWLVRSWRQAWVYSLLCNAISFLSGLLLELLYLCFIK